MGNLKLDLLDFHDVKGFILAPGDIFWKQKSGNMVLLSSKFDFLNLDIIEKLFNAKHELLIENQINLQFQQDFLLYFQNHHNEPLVKQKKEWRHKILVLLSQNICDEGISQLEINQLGWKLFSTIDRIKAKEFIDIDIGLFRRSMSLATTYVFCAFLLGCYSESFLKSLYTDTILASMDFNKEIPITTLKEQLERMRVRESWDETDCLQFQTFFPFISKRDILLSERYDGTGIDKIKQSEMNDLEMIFVALNTQLSYVNESLTNILFNIKNKQFRCDEAVLQNLKRCLYIKPLTETAGDFS